MYLCPPHMELLARRPVSSCFWNPRYSSYRSTLYIRAPGMAGAFGDLASFLGRESGVSVSYPPWPPGGLRDAFNLCGSLGYTGLPLLFDMIYKGPQKKRLGESHTLYFPLIRARGQVCFAGCDRDTERAGGHCLCL